MLKNSIHEPHFHALVPILQALRAGVWGFGNKAFMLGNGMWFTVVLLEATVVYC